MAEYIVFEGIDGAGKSSLIELLVQVLRELNYSVLHIKEPTHMIDNDDAVLSTIDYAYDRYHQLHDIDFDEYDYIVSDRSFYSNLAYQGTTEDLLEWISMVNKYVPRPSHIFFVDIPASLSCTREHGFIDPQEESYLNECRERYYEIIPGKVVIDGRKPLSFSLDYVMSILGIFYDYE